MIHQFKKHSFTSPKNLLVTNRKSLKSISVQLKIPEIKREGMICSGSDSCQN